MKEKYLTLKQLLNLEKKSIEELLDKCLFLNFSDLEKLRMLEYIKSCRLRCLDIEKQLLLEKQSKDKKIHGFIYVSKNKKSNI